MNDNIFYNIHRFDPVIYNMLENQQSKVLGRNDSRLQSMLGVYITLPLLLKQYIDMVYKKV